jgi:hypothetical protein
MKVNLSKISFFISVFALSAIISSCCNPPDSEDLAVTLHPQETSMWCWAASGQMVMHYLGNNVTQCTQANNRFGLTDCPCGQCGPTPDSSPNCVWGGWPEFEKYGFISKHTSNAPLSWIDLKGEIADAANCGKRPFAFTWHWNGGGGHVMVADGYETVDGINFVYMLDPWAPCVGDVRIITYAAYVSGPTYTHWDDYYGVK